MTRYLADEAALDHLVQGFLDCSLPKAEWTHAAHFGVVLWILRHRPDRAAEAEMPPLIHAYNLATGGENTDQAGYHETITRASVAMARAFLGRHPSSRPLHEVLDQLMDTDLGGSDWILAYWTKARLFSAAARRDWVEPDLRDLPR